MRIVHVSTSDLMGGAARAAYRIHRTLVEAGVDSHFLVSQKLSDDPTVTEAFPLRFSTFRRLCRERLDQLPLRFYRQRRPEIFSPNWAANGTVRAILATRPDVVHLHWVNNGFLPVAQLRRLGVPLVWSLWDQWPFTGGCHYSGDCAGYRSACGSCPVLGSSGAHDLSARVLKAKRRHWRGLRFELISPSRWLAERVRTSVLFATHPCTILPQATDTRVFRPVPMEQARTLLGLDPEALVVAFGAINFDTPRKGFALAQAAIASLQPAGRLERMVFCLFGNSSQRVPARIGQIPVRHLGRLEDELSVALVFSAADAALVPSLQDTGPQITAEALACGTPVIGFPVGVTADLVRHGVNGFLAPPFEAAGLAAGLQWAADHRGDPAVRAAAREAAVQQADIRLQLPRYLEIYDRALRGEKPTAE